MDLLTPPLPLPQLAAACMVTVLAAFVKGAVGFAMPMIMISGLASFMPAHEALAALIVPTLLSNLWQAARGGLRAAGLALREYRRFVLVLLVLIAAVAQAVPAAPQAVLFLALGVPVVGFAAVQLAGLRLRIPARRRGLADLGFGALAGISGGIAGVWGPPTVIYLTAIDAPKAQAMRVQGVIYGAGAVVLMAAHLRSGLLDARTLPLSIWLVAPMVAGMVAGQAVQDRLDQDRFRRATLAVLVVVGLNLIRRGVTGDG